MDLLPWSSCGEEKYQKLRQFIFFTRFHLAMKCASQISPSVSVLDTTFIAFPAYCKPTPNFSDCYRAILNSLAVSITYGLVLWPSLSWNNFPIFGTLDLVVQGAYSIWELDFMSLLAANSFTLGLKTQLLQYFPVAKSAFGFVCIFFYIYTRWFKYCSILHWSICLHPCQIFLLV